MGPPPRLWVGRKLGGGREAVLWLWQSFALCTYFHLSPPVTFNMFVLEGV